MNLRFGRVMVNDHKQPLLIRAERRPCHIALKLFLNRDLSPIPKINARAAGCAGELPRAGWAETQPVRQPDGRQCRLFSAPVRWTKTEPFQFAGTAKRVVRPRKKNLRSRRVDRPEGRFEKVFIAALLSNLAHEQKSVLL